MHQIVVVFFRLSFVNPKFYPLAIQDISFSICSTQMQNFRSHLPFMCAIHDWKGTGRRKNIYILPASYAKYKVCQLHLLNNQQLIATKEPKMSEEPTQQFPII